MEIVTDALFEISLVCGVCFLLAAAVTWCFPPKKINALYGYRTSASMLSQDRWVFAQRYATIQMAKAAVAMIVLSFAGCFVPISFGVHFTCGLAITMCGVIYLFASTEKQIKKRFKKS